MTPLVLLPGMMCDARLFTPQIEAINDRAVMVAPISEHDNMFDLAQEILRIAPERFALAGLSMGGIVAMEVVRQASERVAGLCLMGTNPLDEAEEIKARRAPQIAAVKAGGLAKIMQAQMIPHYLHSDHPNAAIEAMCLEMAIGLGEDVFVRQSCALRDRPNQCETLTAYKGSALIIQGEDDRLCPNSRHELMHQLMPQSEYHIIDQAGHLPTVETPEAVNKLLGQWLSAL